MNINGSGALKVKFQTASAAIRDGIWFVGHFLGLSVTATFEADKQLEFSH